MLPFLWATSKGSPIGQSGHPVLKSEKNWKFSTFLVPILFGGNAEQPIFKPFYYLICPF
jgi:hypothetical protein